MPNDQEASELKELAELEELEELERLDSSEIPASKEPPVIGPKLSPTEQAIEYVSTPVIATEQALSLGHFPQLAGASQALLQGKPTIEEYTKWRDFYENMRKQKKQESPLLYGVTESLASGIPFVGAGRSAKATLDVAREIGPKLSTAQKVREAISTGLKPTVAAATIGAAYSPGITEGKIDPFQIDERVRNSLAMAGFGSGLTVTSAGADAIISKAGRLIKRVPFSLLASLTGTKTDDLISYYKELPRLKSQYEAKPGVAIETASELAQNQALKNQEALLKSEKKLAAAEKIEKELPFTIQDEREALDRSKEILNNITKEKTDVAAFKTEDAIRALGNESTEISVLARKAAKESNKKFDLQEILKPIKDHISEAERKLWDKSYINSMKGEISRIEEQFTPKKKEIVLFGPTGQPIEMPQKKVEITSENLSDIVDSLRDIAYQTKPEVAPTKEGIQAQKNWIHRTESAARKLWGPLRKKIGPEGSEYDTLQKASSNVLKLSQALKDYIGTGDSARNFYKQLAEGKAYPTYQKDAFEALNTLKNLKGIDIKSGLDISAEKNAVNNIINKIKKLKRTGEIGYPIVKASDEASAELATVKDMSKATKGMDDISFADTFFENLAKKNVIPQSLTERIKTIEKQGAKGLEKVTDDIRLMAKLDTQYTKGRPTSAIGAIITSQLGRALGGTWWQGPIIWGYISRVHGPDIARQVISATRMLNKGSTAPEVIRAIESSGIPQKTKDQIKNIFSLYLTSRVTEQNNENKRTPIIPAFSQLRPEGIPQE